MNKHKPVAIVDIGSNSVRLVVYSGATRIPSILFNEKVMAGLGRDVGETGEIAADAQERALSALSRFRILTKQMQVVRTRVVATAAVRDASNGEAFLREVRGLGFRPAMLSGEEEGQMAGLGVISAIPDADGIVGDLGGGSLELVDVADGAVASSESLPLGVLRLAPLFAKGEAAVAKKVKKAFDQSGLRKRAKRRPFYMVGGSWRALARLDMLLSDCPLPIMHQYAMDPERLPLLQRAIGEMDKTSKTLATLTSGRLPTLPHALSVLMALVEELRPSALVVSAFGIREGLLYADLDRHMRARDPLIEAMREAGMSLGRFPEHGTLLDQWIEPAFDDSPEEARLRLAACMLSDVAWTAHPDFRAERGMAIALHGNWVGIDLPGRVMLAQALFSNFGGNGSFRELPVARLCTPEQLKRAHQWGLAMRLGQRFSGGVAAALEHSRLGMEEDTLRLTIRRGDEALYGEPVERRLATLAQSLGCSAEAVAA